MAKDKDDNAYLWDMLTAARAVQEFVSDRDFDDYLDDLLLRSAVERQIEIIGEAARCVSKQFQDSHSEILWRPIQAQRHVLAHEYGEIKHDRIWRVATIHIPELIEQLEPLTPTPHRYLKMIPDSDLRDVTKRRSVRRSARGKNSTFHLQVSLL